MDAFQRCSDPDRAELLLSEATLAEVLCTAPLPPVLSPVCVISDDEADDEEVDKVTAYAATDEPDDNPPDVVPPKVHRVRRPSNRDLRASSALKNALVFTVPSQSTVVRKNLVPNFMFTVTSWPDRLATMYTRIWAEFWSRYPTVRLMT